MNDIKVKVSESVEAMKPEAKVRLEIPFEELLGYSDIVLWSLSTNSRLTVFPIANDPSSHFGFLIQFVMRVASAIENLREKYPGVDFGISHED